MLKLVGVEIGFDLRIAIISNLGHLILLFCLFGLRVLLLRSLIMIIILRLAESPSEFGLGLGLGSELGLGLVPYGRHEVYAVWQEIPK